MNLMLLYCCETSNNPCKQLMLGILEDNGAEKVSNYAYKGRSPLHNHSYALTIIP